MSINQNADSIHFSRYPNERQYANALNEGFNITFADRHKHFSYWIADPQDHLRQRFGLVQEVLVLYSEHPIVDARALSAINDLSAEKSLRLRIDKFIYLVIHAGTNQTASDLLRQLSDKVIIPIEAAHLIDQHRGNFFLRTSLADAIGGVNLFDMSSPVQTDRDFFGREDLVQLLTTRSLSKGESSGLFGLRKTGKTSVMFAVERRVYDQPVVTEYVDCQNPGTHARRWWQLLEEISARLFRKTKTAISESAFSDSHKTDAAAAAAFNQDIKHIISKGKIKIILMLDEIEYITHGLSGALGRHWDSDFHPFWATVRAVQQETQGSLTFIVAGVNPSCVEASHFVNIPNPIFQLAVPQYLEPLKRDGLRGMVRTLGRYGGLDFQEDVYDYLRDTYGGHPYLVRLACSEVWKASRNTNPEKNILVGKETFVRLRLAVKQRLSAPIRDILLSLVWWYPEEYDLLRILASGSAEDKDFVKNYLLEMPEQITQFARYGILSGESNNFAIVDLQTFLVDHGLKYKQEISPFSRTEMPQQAIAEVPDLDQLGKLFLQKAEVERDLRRVVLTVIGASVLFDRSRMAKALLQGISPRADRKRPEELFLGREAKDVISDLYTLDLKSIIVAHWEKFKGMFRDNKARFEMNMDGVNLARRADAHTLPLSADEVRDFENSYHWVRGCLRPVIENLPN